MSLERNRRVRRKISSMLKIGDDHKVQRLKTTYYDLLVTPHTGLSTRTLHTGLLNSNSLTRTLHTNSQNGILSHEQRKDLLFILLRPLPRTRCDSCPRDPLPASQHGWEGVVDVTAGFFFLFAEEGEGRLHCSLPNY